MLKSIVDFVALLIEAEGARLLREYGAGEPPRTARGKRSRLERKSTDKFNKTIKKKKSSGAHNQKQKNALEKLQSGLLNKKVQLMIIRVSL